MLETIIEYQALQSFRAIVIVVAELKKSSLAVAFDDFSTFSFKQR